MSWTLSSGPGTPVDALKSPRFSQLITFARLPFIRDLRSGNVLGAFISVPFDGVQHSTPASGLIHNSLELGLDLIYINGY